MEYRASPEGKVEYVPYRMITMIHLGSFEIRTWGLLVSLGLLTGYLVAIWAAKRRGVSVEQLGFLACAGIAGGVLGARLAFALQPSEFHETLLHPIRLIAVWQPGLSLIGGIVLGFLAAGVYAWRAKLPVLTALDVATFGLGPAVAIGRIGCYLNGLHPGKPTTLPWGIYLDGAVRHPIPLYESFLGVLIFVLAIFLFRRRLAPGVTALCLGITYLTLRSALDLLRASGVDGPNVLVWGGFTLTQAATLILVPLLALMAVLLVLKGKGPALGSAAK